MKRTRFLVPAAVLLGLAILAPRAAAEDFDQAALYSKCVKSSVFICTQVKCGMAMGSGSPIDAEKRLVITNYHVVDNEKYVYVQFPIVNKDGSLMTAKKKYIERIPAGQALKGEVLFIDKTRDLALIKLPGLPAGTTAMPLARTSPKTGEQVINIGNPGAVDWTFSTTMGSVRGVGIADMVVGGADEVLRIRARMVTVTNPINPGDSGGPLIDHRGYQVGVSESGRSGVQNVNNCVDVTEIRAFLDEKKIKIRELGDAASLADTLPNDPVGPHSPKAQPKDTKVIPGTTTPGKATPGATTPGATTPMPMQPAGTPAPSAADEAEAAKLLQRANLFKDEEDSTAYKARLKDVVTKFPGTAAAKTAKSTLEKLK